MVKLLSVLFVAALAGCATLSKPGMTQEQVNEDHYQCESDAYSAPRGVVADTYRNCMRARGYN